MNIKILQRLQAVEAVLAVNESPDLVMISYEADQGKYRIFEAYNRKDSKGNVVKGGTDKEKFVDDPKSYIFPEGCKAKVIYDLMQTNFETLFAFSCSELRKSAGFSNDTAFSISYVGDVEGAKHPEGTLEITPYERK